MRLRFTIRDLLWLTALAAVSVGWWIDHRNHQTSYLVQSLLEKNDALMQSLSHIDRLLQQERAKNLRAESK
jgi:hypothetical protein